MPKENVWERLQAYDEADDPVAGVYLMLMKDAEYGRVRMKRSDGSAEGSLTFREFTVLTNHIGADCPSCQIGQLDSFGLKDDGTAVIVCFECDRRFTIKNGVLSQTH